MKNVLLTLVIAAVALALGCEEKPDAEAPTETSAAETTEGAPANEPAEEEATDEPTAPSESGATGQKQELPGDMKDGDEAQFGAAFSIEDEPVSLASALDDADENTGKTIKVSATLDKVCKNKGCWFTLASDESEETVRVRMKDYGFFVPRNADGAQAVVEGVLEKKVIPQAEAQHYADESGETKKVDGDQTEYHFTATAVHLTKTAS